MNTEQELVRLIEANKEKYYRLAYTYEELQFQREGLCAGERK